MILFKKLIAFILGWKTGVPNSIGDLELLHEDFKVNYGFYYHVERCFYEYKSGVRPKHNGEEEDLRISKPNDVLGWRII